MRPDNGELPNKPPWMIAYGSAIQQTQTNKTCLHGRSVKNSDVHACQLGSSFSLPEPKPVLGDIHWTSPWQKKQWT
jgi:hypothetical protein